MKLWIGWLRVIVGIIFDIGKEQQKADDNKTGVDDLVGSILVGIGFILEGVLDYIQGDTENKAPKTLVLKT